MNTIHSLNIDHMKTIILMKTKLYFLILITKQFDLNNLFSIHKCKCNYIATLNCNKIYINCGQVEVLIREYLICATGVKETEDLPS